MVLTQRIDERAILKILPQKGLCTTCAHSSSCIYPRNPERPVSFCEEFEGERAVPKLAAAPLAVKPEPREPEQGRPSVGLCAYCERWLTCTYSKTEAGVWHCEEYL